MLWIFALILSICLVGFLKTIGVLLITFFIALFFGVWFQIRSVKKYMKDVENRDKL